MGADEQGSGTNQNTVKQMQIVRDQLLKFEKEKSNKSEDCDDKKMISRKHQKTTNRKMIELTEGGIAKAMARGLLREEKEVWGIRQGISKR